MNKVVLIGVASGLFLAMGYLASAQNANSVRSKIDLALQEKRALLNERLKYFESQRTAGLCNDDTILSARRDLLNCELELARGKADRAIVLEKKIANAKAYEELLSQRKNIGSPSTSIADLLLAKADRVDVEVALLRESE